MKPGDTILIRWRRDGIEVSTEYGVRLVPLSRPHEVIAEVADQIYGKYVIDNDEQEARGL